MQRRIKSFVLRAGRVSNRQQLALDTQLEFFQLNLSPEPWDLAKIFSNEAAVIVEIGFGMGASLVQMSKNHPELNFIGIEVHRAGVGSLVADLAEFQIKNVRVVMDDAVEIFKSQLQAQSLSKVQIFFPDPWHKKKHNKRRLIQTEFVSIIANSLKPGGVLHCATDWQDYAESMLRVLSQEKFLVNAEPEGGFSPRPLSRPLTKFEQRGKNLGHGVWDLIFIKK